MHILVATAYWLIVTWSSARSQILRQCEGYVPAYPSFSPYIDVDSGVNKCGVDTRRMSARAGPSRDAATHISYEWEFMRSR